jgi:glutathione S-transferase
MRQPSKLYFAPGTCARVSLIALEEIGEPFETQLVSFMAGDHRSEAYLAVNPAGVVPTLVTPTGAVTQTSAILWYLARTYPAANLLPPCVSPVGEAEQLSQLVHYSSDLHPAVSRFVVPFLFVQDSEAQGALRASAARKLELLLASKEAQLAAADWLLGEAWSVLDAYLGWVWFRVTGAGFDAAAFPSIAAHYERLKERPAVRRALEREARAQSELEARGLAVPGVNNG